MVCAIMYQQSITACGAEGWMGEKIDRKVWMGGDVMEGVGKWKFGKQGVDRWHEGCG